VNSVAETVAETLQR